MGGYNRRPLKKSVYRASEKNKGESLNTPKASQVVIYILFGFQLQLQ